MAFDSRSRQTAEESKPMPFISTMKRLLRSPDLKRVLPILLLSSFLANILALALPLAILQILDRVVKNDSLETLTFIAVGVTIALILGELLQAVNGAITSWLGTRFEHSTINGTINHLFKVPMREYNKREPGEYSEKLQSTSRVADFYSGQALLALFDLPFTLLFLGLIYLIAGWLVLVPTVMLLLFILLIAGFGRTISNQIKVRNSSDDRRYAFIYEVLAGFHSVKTLMMERLMERRYERLKEANAWQSEKLSKSNQIAVGMGQLFSQSMIVCVIFAGCIAVIQGDITPGSLAACMMLSVRSLAPMRRALSFWVKYQEFQVASERLDDLHDLETEDRSNQIELDNSNHTLELRDVSLNYSDKAIFDNLSLKIEPGSCIAIKGESGSGKTSLLSILSGIESPDLGQVLVDSNPISSYTASSLHKNIGFIPQRSTIVTGTILENITMYDESLNERAMEVAEKLGLDRIVKGMKLGYETQLGENNQAGFSEGVKQLISIARILAEDPKIILFDEANISLDMDSDKVLREYLESLIGTVTLVLVTHRPSYTRMAEHIYHVVDGKLTDQAPEEDSFEFCPVKISHPYDNKSATRLIESHFSSPTDLSNCLCPLLESLGYHSQQRELAELLPHIEPELTLSGFISVLANFGFTPRSLGNMSQSPDHRLYPCLFIPDRGHAKVILEKLPDNQLLILDGETGMETVINKLEESGEFYIFEQQSTDQDTTHHSWIRDQAWRFRKHLALIMGITVLSSLLALAPPLFVMSIYDWALPTESTDIAIQLLMGVGIAIALNGVLTLLRSKMLAYIAGRFEYLLGVSIFQKIINLPATMVEGVSVSRQINRIHSLERIRDFVVGPMASLAFDVPAVVIILFALAFLNPWLLLIFAISASAFLLLSIIMQGLNKRNTHVAEVDSAHRWEFINETLNTMPTIRSAGAEENWKTRLRSLSGKASMGVFKGYYFQMRYSHYAQFLGNFTGLASLVVSAVLASKGLISSGVLIASLIMTWRLVGPILNLFQAANSLPQLRNNIKQLQNLMKMQLEQDGGVRQVIRPKISGNFSLSRMSFRYANDADPVLLGVTFNAPAGRVVAITGPDGAGKSSLLKLLQRVYSPQAGTIRLDNIDIRQMSTSDLRSQISYMPQNFNAFYGTISQNLRLIHPSATDAELEWAAAMAGLIDDVLNMPEGFNTRISSSQSSQLPNGFRQRLSLARTMLKPASVVLLDEPGTGMDQSGEEALVRCINWLKGKTTVIMVTARPSHLRMADHVLYMERGSITASGPFEKVKDKVFGG